MNLKFTRPRLLLSLGFVLCCALGGMALYGNVFFTNNAILIPVGVDDIYGYINQKGKWEITPRFDAANPFEEDGTAWVEFKGKYGRINSKGEWVLEPTFLEVASISNGLAAAAQRKDPYEREKWGYIDAKGVWVIEPKFEDVSPFFC